VLSVFLVLWCFVLFGLLCVPSVLWHCRLGHLTCKNPSPYDLYCVGGTLSLTQSINHNDPGLPRTGRHSHVRSACTGVEVSVSAAATMLVTRLRTTNDGSMSIRAFHVASDDRPWDNYYHAASSVQMDGVLVCVHSCNCCCCMILSVWPLGAAISHSRQIPWSMLR